MNIAKNMEIIFAAAVVVVSATSFATAAVNPPVIEVKADTVTMPTVTVTAKRLTAAEKAAL
ncbi:hypothetical protein KW842_22550 [Duganella sp. sic0402]|jgi:hypothetical protein|uniref:hypothetical protein n=1 Tax=Duganella sp. sic0402 TaxID=2854786 RepID=UPI001C443359|nr:hypothetical protein [Duganella sp. sic0402]MBV7538562.1 hypothetical protein [Duganella sp. sic0402]